MTLPFDLNFYLKDLNNARDPECQNNLEKEEEGQRTQTAKFKACHTSFHSQDCVVTG